MTLQPARRHSHRFAPPEPSASKSQLNAMGTGWERNSSGGFFREEVLAVRQRSKITISHYITNTYLNSIRCLKVVFADSLSRIPQHRPFPHGRLAGQGDTTSWHVRERIFAT